VAVAGALGRAAVDIENLLGALLLARGRLLLANPRAETADLDRLLLAATGTPGGAEPSGLAGAPTVLIDYTNWRGERGERAVLPGQLWWGHTEFHPVPQYLLRAIDAQNGKVRDFAMNDIHSWKPLPMEAS
jgi:hypothetical protein